MKSNKQKRHLEKLIKINTNKKRTGEYIICENCGIKFYVYKSRLKQRKTRFCSHKCYSRKGKNNNQYGNKGKENHNWKGGRQWNGGYIVIKFSNGYRMYEHRLLVEEKIGRKLLKNEEVHHINMNRSDNRLKNLYLFEKPKHKAYHNLKNKPKLKSNIC